MKMMLEQSRVNCNIFLDVDNLESLDNLATIVRSDVAHFVILMTPEVFTRPWYILTFKKEHKNLYPTYCIFLFCHEFRCAIEIASAYKSGVSMIPVACYLDTDPGADENTVMMSLDKILPDCIPQNMGEDFWYLIFFIDLHVFYCT